MLGAARKSESGCDTVEQSSGEGIRQISNPLLVPAALLFLAPLNGIFAQEQLGRQSVGISSTYSPDSSHILIGQSEGRRTWTAGIDYSRRILGGRSNRLDYTVSVSPLFLESDPTVRAITGTANGQQITEVLSQPVRPILDNGGSFGPTLTTSGVVIAYPVYGRRELTYAFSVSPLGFRWSGLQRLRIQPTFGADAGFVYAKRPIPIDSATSFNYEFDFGPGLQFVTARREAFRLEYLYRHISNAYQGESNPGIDSGVFRLSWSRFYR